MEDAPQFSVTYEEAEGGTAVLSLTGEIDIYSAPTFKEALIGGVDAGAQRIVVDLTLVSFIDSTALGVLVSGAKRIHLRNGKIDIICPDESIVRVFEITGLNQTFSIYPSKEAALAPLEP